MIMIYEGGFLVSCELSNNVSLLSIKIILSLIVTECFRFQINVLNEIE